MPCTCGEFRNIQSTDTLVERGGFFQIVDNQGHLTYSIEIIVQPSVSQTSAKDESGYHCSHGGIMFIGYRTEIKPFKRVTGNSVMMDLKNLHIQYERWGPHQAIKFCL